MAYCSNCGNQLSGTAKFCSKCGQQISTIEKKVSKPKWSLEKFLIDNPPNEKGVIKCPRCLGKGHVEKKDIIRLGMDGLLLVGDCQYCDGVGLVNIKKIDLVPIDFLEEDIVSPLIEKDNFHKIPSKDSINPKYKEKLINKDNLEVDEDDDEYEEDDVEQAIKIKKPFYKGFWFWFWLILDVLFLIAVLNGDKESLLFVLLITGMYLFWNGFIKDDSWWGEKLSKIFSGKIWKIIFIILIILFIVLRAIISSL